MTQYSGQLPKQRRIETEARDNCDQSGNEKSVPVYEFRMQKTMGRTSSDGPERVKSLDYETRGSQSKLCLKSVKAQLGK